MKWLKLLILIGILIYETDRKQIYISSKSYVKRDVRISILRNYLAEKNSPMVQSADTFIKISDKYKLDWKLLPSIAGVESSFETAGNTHDFNPFGYMCGSSPCTFSSYSEAINTVGRTISRGSAYKEFQKSRSIYDLAIVYNQVYPNEWTKNVEYFRRSIR